MRALISMVSGYIATPLLPRSDREWALRLLPAVAVAILAAVLLVHAFSPAGLSVTEFLSHVISVWLGFLLGMVVAGLLVFKLVRARAWQPTVGWLWLTSGLGFMLGLGFVGLIDSTGFLADTSAKAASLHGPRSMLLRLVPVWALVTAFLLRSEMLDAYESRFGALRLRPLLTPAEGKSSGRVILGSGKSSVDTDVSSIVLVSAEENYCKVVSRDEGGHISSALVRATLHSVEQELPANRFIRLHRSHLANVEYVERILRRGRRFFVVLRNWDQEVPISRSRVDSVLARLEV